MCCPDNNGVHKKIRKIVAFPDIGDLNLDHSSVLQGNDKLFFAGERRVRFENPAIFRRINDTHKTFVTESYVFDVRNEHIRVFSCRKAEQDRKIPETYRSCALKVVFEHISRGRIGVLEVDRISENRKSDCLKRYRFFGDVHLQIVLPGGQFFHVEVTGVYVARVGSGVIIIPDLVGKREVDDVNVRNVILSDQICKLIIQKFESDGNASRSRLELDTVFYECNVEKKSVAFVVIGVKAGVQRFQISIVVVVNGRAANRTHDELGVDRYCPLIGEDGRDSDFSVVPDVPCPVGRPVPGFISRSAPTGILHRGSTVFLRFGRPLKSIVVSKHHRGVAENR